VEADCKFRDVCAWNTELGGVGGCFEIPDCQSNCQDCIDESSCSLTAGGNCTWFHDNDTCDYSWCDRLCNFCRNEDSCIESEADCVWDGIKCENVVETELTQICDSSFCESEGGDCNAGLLEEFTCKGGLEAVLISDWKVTCVNRSTNTAYNDC